MKKYICFAACFIMFAMFIYMSDDVFALDVGEETVTVTESGDASAEEQDPVPEPEPEPVIKLGKATIKKVTVTSTGYKVEWSTVENAGKYQVYCRKYGTTTWKLQGTTKKTSYSIKNLKSGVKYQFKIDAVSADQQSSGKIKSVYFLSEPDGIKTSNERSGMRITWNAVNGATRYKVYYKTGTGKWKYAGSSKKASYLVTGLKTGRTYQFTVKAQRGSFVSTHSTTGKTYTRLTVTSISQLTRYTDGTVYFSWGKKSNVDGYQIAWSTDSKFADAKTKTIKGTDRTSYTFDASMLSTAKDTFVRVRTYQIVSGKKMYSAWSQKARLIVYKTSWKYASNSKIHTGSPTLYYSSSSDRKGITVAVNAGHGTYGGSYYYTLCHPDGSPKVTAGSTAAGSTYAICVSSGTLLSNMSEAEGNLAIALRLKKLLLKNGYDVLMIRESDDMQLDNVARTVIANRYADCHISIHYDASSSDKGAYFIGVPDIASYRNMEPVKTCYKQHNKLGKCLITGLDHAGVKIWGNGRADLDLTQTSYSTIPSVDVEVGDRASITSGSQFVKIASGLMSGVDSYF